ncbi:hypothetical protein BDZ91DRAFT_151983 [Kalaharituber pfeilii]|nr:hypothetical protein BDZ91DRAFT_151983 [Kalaharituber pfeilii]
MDREKFSFLLAFPPFTPCFLFILSFTDYYCLIFFSSVQFYVNLAFAGVLLCYFFILFYFIFFFLFFSWLLLLVEYIVWDNLINLLFLVSCFSFFFAFFFLFFFLFFLWVLLWVFALLFCHIVRCVLRVAFFFLLFGVRLYS